MVCREQWVWEGEREEWRQRGQRREGGCGRERGEGRGQCLGEREFIKLIKASFRGRRGPLPPLGELLPP